MSADVHADLAYGDRPLSAWLRQMASLDLAQREQAAATWEKIGAGIKEAVALLLVTLKSPEVGVRAQTVATLGILGEQLNPLVPTLRAVLREMALKDNNEDVRANALHALTQTGPQTRTEIPALMDSLKDDLAAVRFGAASALGDHGAEAKPAVAALIQALHDSDASVRVQAAVALWKIDHRDRAAVPVLVKALKERDEVVRWMAADGLCGIGASAKEAVPALLEAAKGTFKIGLVRKGILLALEHIDPAAAAKVAR